jgi:branched-chain amino acid transport system substrate-binding protein
MHPSKPINARSTVVSPPAAARAALPAVVEPKTCTATGPPIRLGQVGSFSGVLGPVNAGGRTGLSVWVSAVNAHGGIDCHPVQLFVVDDGADPARTAAAVQDLVETKKVLALVATFTTLTEAALKDAAEKYKVPVVGGDVIGFEWNSSPYMFPEGAGFRDLAFGLLKQAADAGLPKFGLLYCVETPTCTTLDGLVEKEAKEAGATVVSSQPVSITQIDYTAQCQNAKNAGAQVFGVAADGASISRLVRSCDAIGYRPPIVTGAAILSPGNATDPGIRRDTLLSASIVAPWMLSDTGGQSDNDRCPGRPGPRQRRDPRRPHATPDIHPGQARTRNPLHLLHKARRERLDCASRHAPGVPTRLSTSLMPASIGRRSSGPRSATSAAWEAA